MLTSFKIMFLKNKKTGYMRYAYAISLHRGWVQPLVISRIEGDGQYYLQIICTLKIQFDF